MGTTALRHLLKSLCNNSCWNYAVLWKLRPGSPMILTWEDGYFDYPKPREPAQSISENIFCSDGGCILSPLSEVSSSIRSSGECRIGLVVADMLNLWYAFGEGAVGKVACSGIHFWVSFSDILNSEINPEFVSKCPEEWLFQFESGIRTVLLVPVLPHGVLQLGSMEEVTEDIEIVAQIKHRFDGVHWVGDISGPFTPNESTEAHFSSLLMSSPTGYSNTTSRVEVSLVKCEDSNESIDAHSAKLPKDNMLEAQKHESETGADVVQIGLAEISQIESINSDQLDMMESKLFELSYLMEELQQYSDLNGYDLQLFAESLKEIMNTYPDGDMQNPLYGIEAANDVDCRNRNNSLNFPMDCELHKALGSAFQTQANEKFWNLVGDCGSSKMFFSKDFGEITEPSRSARGSDAEYLLEAVIANVCYGPEHPLYSSNSLKSSTSQPEHLGGLCLPQNQCEVRDSVGTDSVKLSHFTSSSVTGNTNFTTIDAVNSTMSTVREESPERGYNLEKLQKGQKMPKTNRRVRPGDKQKPRPRDRQLIQDRVKELRELVPNGAKVVCHSSSISLIVILLVLSSSI